MKLEQFFITITVLLAFFTGGLVFLGEGLLTQNMGVQKPPEFVSTAALTSSLEGTRDDMITEVFTQKNPGQTDEDLDLSEIGFWSYSGRALKAVGYEAGTLNPSESTFDEVFRYLKINPIITITIAAVLGISLSAAFIAFWKKRP